MKQQNFNQQNRLSELISEYEAMSQKGTVGIYEETVFIDFANHYKSDNKIDQALQVVEHGLLQYHYSAPLYFCKAKLLADSNQNNLALKAANKALVCAPSDEKIHRFRGQLLLLIQDAKEENLLEDESYYQPFPKFSLDGTFISKAKIDEQFEDIEELYNRLKNKLRQEPQNELALNKILFCVEINQRYEDSIAFHLELIEKTPYSHLAWYNIGQAYSYLRQYENAADAFEYAFIAYDTFLPAYKAYADVCFKLNDYTRALNAFEDLLRKTEPDSELLSSIGECYEMKEDYSVAYLFYTKAIKIDPNCSYAHYRLGQCFAKQRKWSNAILSYQKAISINGRKEAYYAILGEAYFQTNNYKGAFECFERAADLTPDIVTYWLQLITFLIDTEQFELAWEKAEEAELHLPFPSAEMAYAKVACLYLMKKRKAAKRLLMDTLFSHYPKHELLFEYAPEIEEDLAYIALINVCNQN